MRIFAFVLFVLPLGLQAQTEALTLDQAVDEALHNNSGIKASQFEVDASTALRGTSTDVGKTSVLGMFGQYNSYAHDNNFTISQTIPFTAFGSQASLNRAQEQASILKKAVTENELTYQVKQAYYQLAYTRARHRLLLQQDSLYEGFLKSATARYKTGEGKLLEQTTAEVQRNDTKNQIMQNEANATILRTQLMTLLNRSTLPEIPAITFTELNARVSADTASASNPALAYMKQQLEVAKDQKKVEAAKLAPDLIVGYFNQTLIGIPDPETGRLSTGSTRFSGFQLGLAIPLWFVPNRARSRAAELNKQAVQSNYQNYSQSLGGQIQQALQQVQKNKSSIEYYRSSALPNANLILKQIQTEFRAGDIGYAEYLLGVKSALSIKDGYLQTLNDYNHSLIFLEFLTGAK